MPTWRGWDKQQLRQQSRGNKAPTNASGSTTSGIMGFTPINASQGPQSAPEHPPVTEAHNHGRIPVQSLPATTAQMPPTVQTTVAAYLGRGEPETPAPLMQALHGPGTKKSATRGKKRATTTQAVTRLSKRCKGSDLNDGVSVMKPKEKITDGKDKAATALESRSQLQASSIAEVSNAGGIAMAVYAPPTSMDAVATQMPMQQTSIQVAKAANGRKKTLYRRVAMRGVEVTGVTYAQTARPLIEQASAAVILTTHVPAVNETEQTKERPRHVGEQQSKRPNHSRQEGIIWTEDDFPNDFPDDFGNDDTDDTGSKRLADKTGAEGLASQLVTNHKRTDLQQGDEQVENCFSVERKSPPAKDSLSAQETDDNELEGIMNRVTPQIVTKLCQMEPQSAQGATSRPTSESMRRSKRASQDQSHTRILNPDEGYCLASDYDEVEEGPGFVDASDGPVIQEPLSPAETPRDRRLNVHEVSPTENYNGALLTDEERAFLSSIKSNDSSPSHRPILRAPFPAPLAARSPLYGTSNSPCLRTCFRIGEALKAGAQAVRANRPVIVELFCRIKRSWREGRKQLFELRDLYHSKPPFLSGVWEAWSGSRVWDGEGRGLLWTGLDKKTGSDQGNCDEEERRMCRVIGRIMRSGRGWEMEILGAQRAGWEDVRFVAGIYGVESS